MDHTNQYDSYRTEWRKFKTLLWLNLFLLKLLLVFAKFGLLIDLG